MVDLFTSRPIYQKFCPTAIVIMIFKNELFFKVSLTETLLNSIILFSTLLLNFKNFSEDDTNVLYSIMRQHPMFSVWAEKSSTITYLHFTSSVPTNNTHRNDLYIEKLIVGIRLTQNNKMRSEKTVNMPCP